MLELSHQEGEEVDPGAAGPGWRWLWGCTSATQEGHCDCCALLKPLCVFLHPFTTADHPGNHAPDKLHPLSLSHSSHQCFLALPPRSTVCWLGSC